MKKIFLAVLFVLLALPGIASAADVKTADNTGNVAIEKDATPRNLYTAGGNIDVKANVKGDLAMAGGNINIDGNTERSVLVAAGTVNLNGEIGQSARIMAGNTVLKGKIGEDLVLLGGTLKINKDAVIKGDLLIIAGQVIIDGKIEGGIISSGMGQITINGSVGKDATLGEVGNLTINAGASIAGKLSYSGSQEGTIAGTAKIGSVEYKKVSKNISMYGMSVPLVLYSAILQLVGVLFVLFAMLYFVPKTTASFVKRSLARPLSSFWWGLVSVIIIPVLVVLLLISTIGAKAGLMLLLAYPILLLIAQALSCLLVGSLLLKHGKEYPVNWKSILLGSIVTGVLAMIPTIGWIVVLIFFFISSGQLLQMFMDKINRQRK